MIDQARQAFLEHKNIDAPAIGTSTTTPEQVNVEKAERRESKK